MWCIVIRDVDGDYFREVVDDFPDEAELNYWERHHQCTASKPHGTYYDMTVQATVQAVVVNVFKISED
tara:strand:- start:74146 stop:74349 length:204 start_codon:yes stop_codon:yes gene_type:complete